MCEQLPILPSFGEQSPHARTTYLHVLSCPSSYPSTPQLGLCGCQAPSPLRHLSATPAATSLPCILACALQALLAWLHHGPLERSVTGVEVVWGTASGEFRGLFEVR